MAFSASLTTEVRTTGSDTLNGGGFDPGNCTFATDLVGASATGAAPTVSSVSYAFVSGDIGAWLYIAAGTNWVPGWYKITGVAGGVATVDASIGTFGDSNGAARTAAGCATTASPTGGSWTVDYSQQDAVQISYTDIVIDGTTNTKATSAAHPFDVNLVGNIIKVASGTGFSVQRVQIKSVTSNAATVDKSWGTLGSTGGTGKLGGAFATPGGAFSIAVAGMRCYIQSGTYTTSTTSANVAGGGLSNVGAAVRIKGYQTDRCDHTGTRPVYQAGVASTLFIQTGSGDALWVDNIVFDGNAQATTTGINFTKNYWRITRCKFMNFTGVAITTAASDFITIDRCEFTVCSGTCAIQAKSSAHIRWCDFHANSVASINIATGNTAVRVEWCNFYANTHDCIAAANPAGIWIGNCNFYGGTVNGVNITSFTADQTCEIVNCIFEGFTTAAKKGILVNASGTSTVRVLSCAFYNNTADIDTNVPSLNIEGKITLTASPFTNAGSGDFSLNNTASAGASVRRAGLPGTFPAGTSVSYSDVGAVQVGDTGSSGGGGGASRARVAVGF